MPRSRLRSRPVVVTGALLGLVALVGAVLLALGVGGGPRPQESSAPAAEPGSPGAPTADTGRAEVAEQLARLERRHGARVGLLALDTATGEQLDHRADERFAMASTVKVLLAGAVLDRLSGAELEERRSWSEDDLVPHSPVTGPAVEEGMTVGDLVSAALVESDNTATNLLHEVLGGPDALGRWLVEQGDTVTSVDRLEPDLNLWRPGEVRDTSTPRALAEAVRALTLDDVLDPSPRALLRAGMAQSRTGLGLVRAGVPDTWEVGDRSGSATFGTRNDVAVVRPPGRDPWVLAVLTTHDAAEAEPDDALVAQVTRVVVDHWS